MTEQKESIVALNNMSYFDTDVQTAVGTSHTQADGSNIGGVPPTSYGSFLLPGKKKYLFLYTEGSSQTGGYPAWMWYPKTPRTLLSSNGYITLHLESALNGDLTSLNARETDLIVVKDGFKYNGSLQFLQGTGFQVADVNGNWQSIDFNPGPLQVDEANSLKVEYFFDYTKHLTSILQINDKATSASFLEIPAIASTWEEGVYFQTQLSSLPAATAWAMKFRTSIEYVE